MLDPGRLALHINGMTYTDLPFDAQNAAALLADAAHGADDGDIYVQRSRSESFVFDDGRLKSATYDSTQGFGLRVVAGEASGNAHSGELSLSAIERAAETARQAKRGYTGALDTSPTPTNRRLYQPIDPTEAPDFTVKTGLLAEIEAWVRAKDPRVVQVSVSLSGSHEQIDILRPAGEVFHDIRPLVRLNISVTLEQNGRRESASAGAGGRAAYDEWIEPSRWQG